MNRLIRSVVFVVVCGVAIVACAAPSKPNIVLVFADDLGWMDLSCYGNKFNETPNIDRLASQGVKFNRFYAHPVCSPSRAAILTGLYPARFGLTAHIPGHWRPFEKLVEPPCALSLPHDVPTIAQTLRAAGYATAQFGKWHLGEGRGAPEHTSPTDYGFGTAFSFTAHDIPANRLNQDKEYQKTPATGPKRLAEYLADRAIDFMERHREQPFFIYLCHHSVHIPLSTTPELRKKYEAKGKDPNYPSNPLYAGLLEEMDISTGRVMEAIDRLKLTDNTILIFVSDNGGLEREMGGSPATSNRPLRSEKGTLYEGGIRVPAIVRWPGVTKAGSVCETPGPLIDFYPTFLDAAGLTLPPDQVMDGVSLVPVLRDAKAQLARQALFWHYPHYHHSRPSDAVILGDLKAIEFFDTGAVELYNLKDDPSETTDLAAKDPVTARQLQSLLRTWRQSVNAQMPQANPAYDPARVNEWYSRATVEPTRAPGAPRAEGEGGRGKGKGKKRAAE